MHYTMNETNDFVIQNFDQQKPFSSFLPGISGVKGIPMWAFYVNRGQGISSFGIEDKNSPIMEFFPANTSYQYVSTYGFRSFVKIDGRIYEPFATIEESEAITRAMTIRNSDFTIEEVNTDLGLKYSVTYFGLPNETLGAIVRQVTIESLIENLEIEILDGMAAVIPYGITNSGYKEMSNLSKSWMEVYNLDNQVPFFTVRASMGDEAEVSTVTRGHFYLSYTADGVIHQPIVDPKLIFGENMSLNYPSNFAHHNLETITHLPQVTVNKVPCSFTPVKTVLSLGKPFVLNTLIGHVESLDLLMKKVPELIGTAYVQNKQVEAKVLIDDMLGDIETHTSNQALDAYIAQSYLDNLLRGGYPMILKGAKNQYVYYVYSRKHGDPEREYNFFKLMPEFYSNGEGNFRDVNQNRRSDVYFNPEVGTYNIELFMNLMQLDGYNPLVVKGAEFVLTSTCDKEMLVSKHFATHQADMLRLLSNHFTPGKIINTINNKGIQLLTNEEALMKDIIDQAIQTDEARHGEGFWSDHFTYNLDLIEAYLDIFPDQLENLLTGDSHYRFFDSIERVLPRKDKHVLTKAGKVRQYGAAIKDTEKIKELNMDANGTNWVKTNSGVGEIFETNLLVKLMTLGLTKFSLLDPCGMGIEMEGNKPGWNDAMNGLPGLFGSTLGETFELKRILNFLSDAIAQIPNKNLQVPEEIWMLWQGLEKLVVNEGLDANSFNYWEASCSLREAYREQIRFGLTGNCVDIQTSDLTKGLETFILKVEQGLEKAKVIGNGLYPTFFKYTVETYEPILDDKGQPVITHYGLPAVKVLGFTCEALPYFLEAPARFLKATSDTAAARSVHEKVKASGIFDKELKMYKTSESLEGEGHEIGRIRAFTAGWLERESVFLHMTYKYLLGLLEAGLYEEYYEAMATNFVPFMNPEVYGRSTLENSSFIASSVNPDPDTHGQGFVARLSGSNAEVLSMWYLMMVGTKGFQHEQGLSFELAPILTKELFDEKDQVSFKLLNKTLVTYINPTRKHTFGEDSAKVVSMEVYSQTEQIHVVGGKLEQHLAEKLRNGAIVKIIATLA